MAQQHAVFVALDGFTDGGCISRLILAAFA
jgi:hypothetical protein